MCPLLGSRAIEQKKHHKNGDTMDQNAISAVIAEVETLLQRYLRAEGNIGGGPSVSSEIGAFPLEGCPSHPDIRLILRISGDSGQCDLLANSAYDAVHPSHS